MRSEFKRYTAKDFDKLGYAQIGYLRKNLRKLVDNLKRSIMYLNPTFVG